MQQTDADLFEGFYEVDVRKPQKGRALRRVLLILGGLVGVLVLSLVAYVAYLNHVVTSNIAHEKMLPSNARITQNIGGKAVTVDPAKSKGMNILFLGSDARPGDTVSRSDVMLLMHIPEDRKKVYITHLPRDLYVDIPGHGKDKINAAFSFGGAPLAVEAVQNLMGVKIDHAVKTDFDGFQRMTDAVGGVRVFVEESSNEWGFQYQKGWMELDGIRALYFVRERHQLSEGDISRGRRQQAFLKALMLKVLSKDVVTNPVTVAKFADAATSNLKVDDGFSIDQMRSTALSLTDIRSGDIVFITAPFSGYGTGPNGESIDIVNLPAMEMLGKAIREDTLDSYKNVSVTP